LPTFSTFVVIPSKHIYRLVTLQKHVHERQLYPVVNTLTSYSLGCQKKAREPNKNYHQKYWYANTKVRLNVSIWTKCI